MGLTNKYAKWLYSQNAVFFMRTTGTIKLININVVHLVDVQSKKLNDYVNKLYANCCKVRSVHVVDLLMLILSNLVTMLRQSRVTSARRKSEGEGAYVLLFLVCCQTDTCEN